MTEERSAKWTRRADRWGPWLLAAALFAVLSALSLGRLRTVGGYFDQAYFRNAAWLLAHGEDPYIAFRGLPFFGDHFSPAFWLEAMPTRVLPAMPWLLVLQAAALASGLVLVHRIGRHRAGLAVPTALALCAAYGLYPAVSNIAVADFHPEVVAVPALFGAVWFMTARRWIPYAACIAVVLACKEDLALVVAMLGLFLFAFQGERRAGSVTAAVGVLWFVLATQVVIPAFAGGYVYSDLFPGWGDSLPAIVWHGVTHPFTVVRTLGTGTNFLLLVALFAPVLFLPAAAPRWLVPVAPTLLLLMLSARPSMHTVDAQYPAPLIPFVFCATAFALASLWPDGPPARAPAALVIAAAACLGAFSTVDPRVTLYRSGADVARRDAAAMIPGDVAVSADEADWYTIAGRRAFYAFPYPFGPNPLGPRYRDPVPVEQARAETDWILVDTGDEHWDERAEAELARISREHGFGEVFSRDGVRLFARR